MSDPLVGHVLDDRYKVLQRIARGGMATVYQAIDTRLTRTVAVKVMHEGLGDDEDFAKKFDREARSAARLSHPNVVSVFDQGHDRGRPYIVMEYVDGTTLRKVISREAPLEPLRCLDLIDHVLSALAAAHDSGLVHRDVKPENILLSTRGQVKVADFGLARAITAQTATATQGMVIGTVSYLPPELVTTGRADTRSDVYSAGVVLFEMLTGSKPHTGETPIQVAYAHVHADVPVPSSRVDTDWRKSRSAIPPYLDVLVRAATQRNPERRPANARTLQSMVRKARSALASGVMDDPALSMDFDAGLDVQDSTQPVAPPTPLSPAVLDAPLYDPKSSLHVSERVPVSPHPRGATNAAAADAAASGVAGSAPAPPAADQAGASAVAATTSEGTLPSAPDTSLPDHATPDRSSPESTKNRSWRRGAIARRRPNQAATTTPGSPAVLDAYEAFEEVGEREPVAAIPVVPKPIGGRLLHGGGRRARLLLVAVLLVVLCAGGTGGWWYLEGRFQPTPNLVTMNEATAREASQQVRLDVTFEPVFSETAAPGTVVSTRPAAGEDVERGGAVVAWVSKGPERFAMPKVVGLRREDATVALTSAHLRLGALTEEWDESVAAGTVVRSSLEPGAKLKGDTPVDLVVSKGPEPIEIDNYIGRSAQEAAYALHQDGFKIEQRSANSRTVPEGRVISQTPAEGTGKRGDTITITRSLGPVLVTVPPTKAMPVKDATEALQKAGFKVVTQQAPNYINLGVVSDTNPAAGTKAPEGSTITLILV